MKPRSGLDPQMDALASLCVLSWHRLNHLGTPSFQRGWREPGWANQKKVTFLQMLLVIFKIKSKSPSILGKNTPGTTPGSYFQFHCSPLSHVNDALGSSLAQVFAVARMFQALSFSSDSYTWRFCCWKFLKEVQAFFPLGSKCQAELRASTFVHLWYLEICSFIAYFILWNICVHMFLLHQIGSSWRETGLGTI